jgi:Ca-activated chloride channel family protein
MMHSPITFIWLDLLWLLLLVPVLVLSYIYLLRRKKKAAVRFANLPMVKEAMGNTGRIRRHVPPALMLIALTLMILAIARPEAVVTLASARATVIMAMDVSGSMRATDVEPSRLEASQAAAKSFIDQQPRDVAVGIVAFAATALLVQTPTLNRDDLKATIDRFELQRGTNIGGGILVALQTIFPNEDFDQGPADPFAGPGGPNPRFGGGGRRGEGRAIGEAREERPKAETAAPVPPGSYQNAIIILLTDGQPTTGPDPADAARIAANHGVRVFTVGFGSRGGDVVGFGGRFMRTELDEDLLKNIADQTHGQYFPASSEDQLKKIYSDVNAQMIKETKQTEITFFFAAIAFLFALASTVLSFLWFNRVF